ncbi:membrane peptidoglycan carboxypeptidase [Microbacteriaceae bacterium SG_E_30_P1]|uniref:Membrane peptidoglycan carboxypeptidase n=1 Tax=Antiquaquibacter oligotrophicus TaxID=2880260 RepID=A0ABT6KQQ4_9MICO|nr:transglycosylase domain-containing protein [Antiquaquibacter oligotrophicus]MDH6182311.1 membrane peptidoglycan carboxypeptidase [Antiquaquibacter oligotrophicus]UDF12034.1 transglycosylase domain-containing protein [Antiquaquibacter oligotrophicus]
MTRDTRPWYLRHHPAERAPENGLVRFLKGLSGLLAFSLLGGLLLAIGAAPVVGVTGVIAASTTGIFEELPEYLVVDRPNERNTIWAQYTGEGNTNGYFPVATVYLQNRQAVTFDEISPFAINAAIDGEDHRFYEHNGVDTASVMRAVLGNLGSQGIDSGASTITMQLVKNLFVQRALEQPTEAARDAAYEEATAQSFSRKLAEMKYAIGLEKRYTKQEIITAYLNISFFGDNTYGIEAAAQRYYGRAAKDLTLEQAASLIAIVQYPGERGLDNPDNFAENQKRRDTILYAMEDVGSITKDQLNEALAIPVDASTLAPVEGGSGCINAMVEARWFCDFVVKNIENFEGLGATPVERRANWEQGGYDLYTTLDLDVQGNAHNQTTFWAPPNEPAFGLGAATVSVEVGTGRVLTMAENKRFDDSITGGGGDTSAVNYNTSAEYGGSSGFQSGSTYKLFTLIAWLQAGHSLSDSVDGTARTVQQSQFVDTCADSRGPWGGPYPFKNDSGGGGSMSVLSATSGSVNGAFISMALKLDLCAIRNVAESLGVERADGDKLWTNPSSVLGTNQVTPISMAGAYAAIAAGGVYCKPIILDKIVGPDGQDLPGQKPECRQAISPDIAAQASVALRAVMTGGTGSASNPGDGVPILGKTGTTDDSIQTWIVTSTTRVATAVWVGNSVGFYPLSRYGVADASGSQLRHRIMNATMAVINGKYGGGPLP